jgi:DNA-binding beta-propeller fold protein YncE
MQIVSVTALIILLLSPLTITAAPEDRLKRPISLDKIDNGDLFALDATGTVIRLAVSDKKLTITGAFELSAIAYPTDLVSAKLFDQPTLLISSNNQKAGFVSQYSLAGRLEHFWAFRNSVSGLDVDYNSHIVYVASSETSEIFQIKLESSRQIGPSFMGAVLGSRQLGPLVFDVAKNRLFVGDIATGQIFEFDLKTRKSRVFARDLGSPQALLVSSGSDFLYVADASRRKIYAFDLKQGNTSPKVFSALPEFRSPSGLARLEDGRLIVSDDAAGVLFVLSKTGTLQFAFRH